MQNTYHKKTAHFISMVIRNMPALSHEEMDRWSKNPDRIKAVLQPFKFVEEEKCPYQSLEAFVNHGTRDGKTALAVIRGAKEFSVEDEAAEILLYAQMDTCFKLSDTITQLPYLISGENLGIKEGALVSIDDVKKRATSAGLKYCNPETAALYMMYCMDKRKDEASTEPLNFISKSFYDKDHRLVIFTTCYSKGVPTLGITTVPRHDVQCFTAKDKFVFL